MYILASRIGENAFSTRDLIAHIDKSVSLP